MWRSIHSYMAHHQGMSVVAIADVLGDGAMRRRFHAEPMIQATELLLQERMPHDVAMSEPMIETVATAASVGDPILTTQRRFDSPARLSPRTHLLSNGRYARHAHRGRVGLQPLARHCGDTLAGGRDLRLLGQLRLPARQR